jgi:ribosomal protein S12 methylthiotransferase RimO
MSGLAYPDQVGAERVALVTLGCARNEVDSEELAGRLVAAGFDVVDDATSADAVLVNTCGFIEPAKRESIEVLLSAEGRSPEGVQRHVVAVGCMAQRYGRDLADELPGATVLGFDDYPQIAARLRDVLDGRAPASHAPVDRRRLLPLAPAQRPEQRVVHVPGHGPARGPVGAGPHVREERSRPGTGPGPVGAALLEREDGPVGPAWIRHRLDRGPVAALKIASGCDRRCAFCAIPSFRGAFVSRPADEILAEGRWLADQGVREVVLVSENSTSWGKDLGHPAGLEHLLVHLAGLPLVRIRASYLQPAEVGPSLVDTVIATHGIADYFDLSFQHASPRLLRRMRRFGGTESFLALVDSIRRGSPAAGIRTNVIVGFPGETEADVADLVDFLGEARLDAVGVFGYSDEEGTEAAGLPGHLDDAEVRARVDELSGVADLVMAERAEARVGEVVEVLVESVDGHVAAGRAEHQGPEDGATTVHLPPELRPRVRAGSLLRSRVVSSDGVDLHAVEVSVVQL